MPTTRELIARIGYKPGWSFKLAGPEDRYLCVFARTADSMKPGCERITQHQFRLPDAELDERGFAMWVFECLLLCELHEAGEFFAVDGFRPCFPHHQDEGSPYARVDRWEDR